MTCAEFRLIAGHLNVTPSEALHGLKHALGCPECHAIVRAAAVGPRAQQAGRDALHAVMGDPEMRSEVAAVFDACRKG